MEEGYILIHSAPTYGPPFLIRLVPALWHTAHCLSTAGLEPETFIPRHHHPQPLHGTRCLFEARSLFLFLF